MCWQCKTYRSCGSDAVLLLYGCYTRFFQLSLMEEVEQLFKHWGKRQGTIINMTQEKKIRKKAQIICSSTSDIITFLFRWWHEHDRHVKAPHARQTAEDLQRYTRFFIPEQKLRLIYNTALLYQHNCFFYFVNWTSWAPDIFMVGFPNNLLHVKLMQRPQDLIEHVRFKGVMENLDICIRLDLLQHRKTTWLRTLVITKSFHLSSDQHWVFSANSYILTFKLMLTRRNR